ncbi:MAG: hypothetical protein ACETVU_05995, partial [Desulfatiglandales bacterium]
MDFSSFAEGPLLWIVFSVFIIGILARVVFFFSLILKSSKNTHLRWRHILATFGRSLLPFHSALTKRPLYAVL